MNLKIKFAGLDSLLFEDLCKLNIESASLPDVKFGEKLPRIFNGASSSLAEAPVKNVIEDRKKAPCLELDDALDETLKKMNVSSAAENVPNNFAALRDSVVEYM